MGLLTKATIMFHKAMIVLCLGFCYIEDINMYIYIVIQIINTLAENHGSPQGFSPL